MAQPADYPEDLVPILLQAALTAADFPRFRYQILPISRHRDKIKGYDAEVTLRMYTFYMQFKKPWAPTEAQIRTDRTGINLNNNDSDLFFKLHQSAKSKKHDQHNALFNLKAKAKAAYVCPLYTSPSEYQAAVNQSMWEMILPLFSLRKPFFDELYWHELHLNRATSALEDIPAFRNHISIPPHKLIRDKNAHKYSFNKFGLETAFHFPEAVPDVLPLGSWLQEVYTKFGEESFSETDYERLKSLVDVLSEDDVNGFAIPATVSLQTWQMFGDYLELRYGIRQYAFVQRQG